MPEVSGLWSHLWKLSPEFEIRNADYKELWPVCGAVAPLTLTLRHNMKVQRQHQAPSHFNSAHTENRILHVVVTILNEVCVIYDRIIRSRTTEILTVCTSGLHRIPSVNPQAPKQNLDHNLNLAMSELLVTYWQRPYKDE
jgi:hypothetical protein